MKKIIASLISIFIIFTLFYLLKPLDKTPLLPNGFYQISSVNVTPDNTSSTLREIGSGMIFIHPGVKKPTGMLLKVHKDGKLALTFSIQKESHIGNIKFTLLKNGQRIKEFTILAHQQITVSIPVTVFDTIGVWADKNGDTAADWGNIKLQMKEPYFHLKNFLIPFLWSMLFIFLFAKRHQLVVIGTHIGFILALYVEKKNFGSLSFGEMLTYLTFFFGLTFLFVLLYQELRPFKKYKIATILSLVTFVTLYAVPLSFIIYNLNYHTLITTDVLFAIFQSNIDESIAYISDYIDIKYLILFLSLTLIMGALLYIQEIKDKHPVERSLLLFLIIVFFSISSVNFIQLKLPHFILDSYGTYNYELERFKQTLSKRKVGNIHFQAKKSEQGETYVVVIGESLTKRHMGLYGYFRDTTPKLSDMYRSGEISLFHNIYSNHTHTMYVLSLALTEANQYNRKKYYESLSILDILKKANFETYWVTNQPLYSIYDNMLSIIATTADHVVALNNDIGGIHQGEPKYDGATIDRLKHILSKKEKKNRVIFIHLGGSHSTYSDRYPNDRFSRFTTPLKPGVFGNDVYKVDTINTYDNSVYYNDYVVSSLLKLFQKDPSSYAFIYMPDHAEDVEHKKGHNASLFTYYMTQIPMIAWFSERYKQRYPQTYSTFLEHNNTLFSNDLLYDTLIGIFGIKTDRYTPVFDLSSTRYTLDPTQALVLHGKKRYTEQNNHLYWQKINVDLLKKTHLSFNIAPKRINTIAKLQEISNDGFSSFRSDLFFHQGKLFLGRPDSKILGMTLHRFLDHVHTDEVERIVIDIHNLNQTNYKQILQLLSTIEKRYHIKDKLIIETSQKEPFIKDFTDQKWHCSYKMPQTTYTHDDIERLAQQIETAPHFV